MLAEARTANLDVLASGAALRREAEVVGLARAPLRPQLEVGASYTVVDEDQAFFGRAERSLALRVAGSQIVWSESTFANLDVAERGLAARTLEHRTLQLDVMLDAALAYLDVLRAETLERIAIEDLRLTRSNLELAEVRVELGVSGPAEVYRWESRIATARQAVLDARAARRISGIGLARILDRPQDVLPDTLGVATDDEVLGVEERLARALSDPFSLEAFAELEVERALGASPELAAVDEAVAAQERLAASTRRAHWQPIVRLEGSLNDIVDTAGDQAIPPPPFDTAVPDAEITTWTAAAVAGFELYTGGAKRAREREARHELVRLRIEREAAARAVEARMRVGLEAAAASWAGIGLGADAAEAARKNLELVLDSYSRGVVSITELLDAQNAALVAEEGAARAVFDFAADWMRVQRAAGGFDAFRSTAERDAWLDQVDAWIGGGGAGRPAGS